MDGQLTTFFLLALALIWRFLRVIMGVAYMTFLTNTLASVAVSNTHMLNL